MKLTISIVTFNNENVIRDALNSIEKSTLRQSGNCMVIVVDNSSSDKTAAIVSQEFPGVTLVHSPNRGFSAGHNQIIRYALETTGLNPEYHLVMNPDVFFEKDTLEKLVHFMDDEKNIGLIMPKILYPDHQIQYLCKLLPTPFDLFGRRFLPNFFRILFKRQFDSYQFKDRDYNLPMEVPHLSGCFMMIRANVFEKVGLFDERFFIYLEDVDMSRRIHTEFKTLYYPDAQIFHHYHKGSYKRFKHLQYHIASAIKYFNKWGWFFDKERKVINKKIRMASGGQEPFREKVPGPPKASIN
ncbi:MAG: glycosyltransferase family 2 protein [Acidobacteria bacterium]|jgi:hypothetical protein|nr:glycosyltransferase family 2 protein [Acidobacteriota bacterium]